MLLEITCIWPTVIAEFLEWGNGVLIFPSYKFICHTFDVKSPLLFLFKMPFLVNIAIDYIDQDEYEPPKVRVDGKHAKQGIICT